MLRVGLMLDSYVSSAWVAKVVEDIQASDFAQVALVILNSLPPEKESGGQGPWTSGLFRLYEKWDYRRNKQSDDATAPTDVSPLLQGVPMIRVHPQPSGPMGRISESDVTHIRESGLDVILRFGFRPMGGDILTAATYGVWSFSHSSAGRNAEPPFLREVAHRSPVSESTLQIETGAAFKVIYRSQASTDDTSLYRNRNSVFWKSSEFTLRCLRDLNKHGIEDLRSLPVYSEQVRSENHVTGVTGNFQMAAFMMRRVLRGLQARSAARQPENRVKWYLAIRRRKDSYLQRRSRLSPGPVPQRPLSCRCVLVRKGWQNLYLCRRCPVRR